MQKKEKCIILLMVFLCCMHICGCGKVDDGTESDVLWFG
jgi:hypothetical protein